MSWWLGVPVVFLVLTVAAYNRLVRSRERTREAWSGIDVQLTRRADLVPALVEVVRGYAAHERETLEAVIQARSDLMAMTQPPALAGANEVLGSSLGRLFRLAEAYPELRAAEAFLGLQEELSEVEEKLAYARQFYNRNALDFNTRLRRFPTLILARALRYEPFEFFDAGERDLAVSVRLRSSVPERE